MPLHGEKNQSTEKTVIFVIICPASSWAFGSCCSEKKRKKLSKEQQKNQIKSTANKSRERNPLEKDLIFTGKEKGLARTWHFAEEAKGQSDGDPFGRCVILSLGEPREGKRADLFWTWSLKASEVMFGMD